MDVLQRAGLFQRREVFDEVAEVAAGEDGGEFGDHGGETFLALGDVGGDRLRGLEHLDLQRLRALTALDDAELDAGTREFQTIAFGH